eukprot:CAMPEP_0173379588 /NCGR_PEP_ID=MMETSP1356-20130122/2472_1 /TAXON_ID=77927 ORGANISM="Hemiselmis virescens, Strain PCC157" /NCGR_SAMPLE_ID=MMETSP1356 /ASSEMBLY_ACC=CAM_ASM_000847 /LENGTH=122 /DNA_ID=CAMNT_0014332947 /DNA_START=9 /DNA_END=377 /DNA_ORIENTATION=+
MRVAVLALGFVGACQAFTAPFAGAGLRAPALRSPVCRSGISAMSMTEEVAVDAETRISEVKGVITELNEFRDRIIKESTDMAKKVKAKPRDLRKSLESHKDILKIDEAIEQLETELAQLGAK